MASSQRTDACAAVSATGPRPHMTVRWLVGLLACTMLAFAAGWIVASRVGRPDPADLAAQWQRGHLQRLDGNSSPGRVVFLGSSTFQGLDAGGVTPLALNLGLGSDTVEGLQARAARYRSIPAAVAVVVNIGLNDLMAQCRLPRATLESLMAAWPTGLPVGVIGVQGVAPARRQQHCDGRLGALVVAWNSALSSACARRPGCLYADHPVPAEPSADVAGRLLEPDGIHLTPEGYTHFKAVTCGLLARAAVPLGAACPP